MPLKVPALVEPAASEIEEEAADRFLKFRPHLLNVFLGKHAVASPVKCSPSRPKNIAQRGVVIILCDAPPPPSAAPNLSNPM
jgi:hypothetical protein